MSPENFFHGNGVSKVFTSRVALIDPAPPNGHDLAVMAAAKNGQAAGARVRAHDYPQAVAHATTPFTGIDGGVRAHPFSLFDTVMRSRLRHRD